METLAVIFAMTMVTYLPRALPLLLCARRTVPDPLARWLGFVPPAVLAALLAQSVLCVGPSVDMSMENLFLWASVPTALVRWKTRSFAATVAAGILTVALLRAALP
ncbi:hypothetical protein TDMWS_03860 [Thermodesulfomicrobium sp. WS]|uniref:AzlD domain-containing protein n=1 Tax=Thermodesulfomicrobium sp. WS TaxID=3004129 RepID=UPI0024915F63|nr:AzlD domain-containing protein [Thermodesulfomicrobium sp. WS]BDV00301.1 hypothetical protein TDMWS_03860 [Thermodesulfomicrobium sp. WS]